MNPISQLNSEITSLKLVAEENSTLATSRMTDLTAKDAELRELRDEFTRLVKAIIVYDNSRMYIGQVQVADVRRAETALAFSRSNGERDE